MSDRVAAPPPWEFGYAPVCPAAGSPEPARALVVATPRAVAPARIAAASGPGASAAGVFARAPIFWTSLSLERPALPAEIAARLVEAGVAVRYVASAERPSLALAPPLDPRLHVHDARPDRWRRRPPEPVPPVAAGSGSWFLGGDGGVAVNRERGDTGAGTRLAVIDDDALGTDELGLDAEVLVLLERAPRHQLHGALMVAWATRSRAFAGVAPGASARLYLIPKPGTGVLALPLAIARAADDGADVILCATYAEGTTSPMLDDALELATRLGRRGRGAAVVMPTGREASSAPGSVHASFSLGLGEPASDPRVFCIAPGARGGGWFLWRDRRGRLRPFANRGPAVRWLAPGDDVAFPFSTPAAPRLFHAESSGAAAIAAGVLLLVLGASPRLRRRELAAVVDATLAPPAAASTAEPGPLADPADLMPSGRDRDGHDARHGYGLLAAEDACLFARDPVCAALLTMGEPGAARAFADARRRDARVAGAYSDRLARWAVRALLADREAAHALRAILRHARLVAGREERAAAHGEGAWTRQIGLLLRRLASSRTPGAASVRAELGELSRRVIAATADPETIGALEARILDALAGAIDAR